MSAKPLSEPVDKTPPTRTVNWFGRKSPLIDIAQTLALLAALAWLIYAGAAASSLEQRI